MALITTGGSDYASVRPSIYRRIRGWLSQKFRRAETPSVYATVAEEPAPEAALPNGTEKRVRSRHAPTLPLDRIDSQFAFAAKVREAFPAVERDLPAAGINVVSPTGDWRLQDLAPSYIASPPEFGCYVIDTSAATTSAYPSMLCFFRLAERPECFNPYFPVEFTEYNYVRIVAVYQHEKTTTLHEFMARIATSGEITIGRVMPQDKPLTRHKTGISRKLNKSVRALGLTPDSFSTWLFFLAMECHAKAAANIHSVTAKSATAEITYRFNGASTPRLFSNHGDVEGKQIFHMVKTHTRRGKPIDPHFRGAREFDWRGYHIILAAP